MALSTRTLEPAIAQQKIQLACASKHAIASVSAIDLVKVFGGEDQEVWQYLQAVRRAAGPYLTQALANSFQMGYLAFWIILLFVIGFWYGVKLVNDGGWTPGQIFTTFYATLNAFQSIEAFMPQWLVIAKGMAAGHGLSELCRDTSDREPCEAVPMPTTHPARLGGQIELNDVSRAHLSNI